MDAQKFGAFIAEMRKARDLTQAALAARLHVTDKAVSRWERGLGFPDINTMEPLAAALGVTILELMRSERLPEGAVSNEEASEAITDTLTFAQQRRASLFFDITAGLACLLCAGMTFFLFGTGAVAEILFFFGAIGVMVIGVHRYVSEASIQKRRYGAIAAGIACIFLLLAGGSLLGSSPSTSRYAALFMAYFFPVMLACWLMLLLRRVRAWLGGEDLIFWGDFFSTSGELGSELGASLSPKARSLINIAFAPLLTVECVFYTVHSVSYAAEALRTPPEETVTRQYAALCLERDFGVAEEQLTGTVFTLTPRDEWEGWDDLYSYTFTWQSGDGAASQCYSVVFYDDYSCEALGHGADFDASLDAANRELYRRMHGLPET